MWHDVQQNTDEWLDMRVGKLTGSGVKTIMVLPNEYQVMQTSKDSFGIANLTTKKVLVKRYPNKIDADLALSEMKKKKRASGVFTELTKKLSVYKACEQITGKRSLNESYSSPHMERGHEQEPIARALYEEQNFVDVTNGGFFECGALGCSPDGLVSDDGLIEIKSVIDHVQYATIKRGGFDPSYRWQIYFNLMQSGREWIDYVSYCADFPEKTQLYVFRVYREECAKQFEMLDLRIQEFFSLVNEAKLIIKG